jgi:cytochrome P450
LATVFCLGAPLARLEAQLGLEALFASLGIRRPVELPFRAIPAR